MPRSATLGLLTTLAAFVVAIPAPAQAPPVALEAWQRVEDTWRAEVQKSGIVGSSLALVVDGRAVRHATEGLADLARGRAVDDNTIYHWASITKTLTAVSILQLRDRGLLDLDDPVTDYVPELAAVYNPFGEMEEITIRQLLSHTAGFRASTWPWGGDRDWHPHEPTEWSQLVAMMPYTRIGFEPGSGFSYSNPGIIFLGRVIEAVTGDVYEAYVDKNLFRPLGMSRAYFDVTPWHLLEHRSNNYRVLDGRPVANGLDFNTGVTVSNGGLNAPLEDMVRWVAFLLGSPATDVATYESVLARASLEEMWRAVQSTGGDAMGGESIGLSFFLYRPGGMRLVGHTGSQKSFQAFMLLAPDHGVGALAAFNTSGGDETAPRTRAIMMELRERVASEVFTKLGRTGA